MSVVANDAPPLAVAVQVPVVAAENADAEVPAAVNVTIGAGVQPPSFKIVVILVAVVGVPTADTGAVMLSMAIW